MGSSDDLKNAVLKLYENLDCMLLDSGMRLKNGDHILPYIRHTVLSKVVYEGFLGLLEPDYRSKLSPKEIFTYFLRILLKRFGKNFRKTDFVFFTTTAERFKSTLNTISPFGSTIADYFLGFTNGSFLILEDSYQCKFFKVPYEKNLFPHDYIRLVYFLKSVLIETFHLFLKDHPTIDGLKTKLEQVGEVLQKEMRNDILDYLCQTLKAYDLKITHAEKVYVKLFKKLKPRYVFIHGASYGGFKSLITKIAKNSGAKTAEFQHGILSSIHPAYNYSKVVFQICGEYLPDYLLTYGEYWNNILSFPNKCFTIGNPYLCKIASHFKSQNKSEQAVLIVSQSTLTDVYVRLAKQLSQKLGKGFQIYFKLHPREIPFRDRYQELFCYENIKVIDRGNIYEYLKRIKYVVTVYSTVAFETLLFGNVLLIYEHYMSNLYIPKEIGFWFQDVDQLSYFIKQNPKVEKSVDVNLYWNCDWENKFKHFLVD